MVAADEIAGVVQTCVYVVDGVGVGDLGRVSRPRFELWQTDKNCSIIVYGR